MAKTKEQKKEAIKFYKDQIAKSSAILFVRPSGITANESIRIKMDMYNNGANFHVIKNNLFKIALKDSDMPEISDLELGANAVIFVENDVAGAAKLLNKYVKELDTRIEPGFGIMEGSLLSKEQVKELADMPSREVIVAQIAGLLVNPIAGVAGVLENSVSSLAYILDQAFQEK